MCECRLASSDRTHLRIIATPGRLLHLVVEMNYDMRSIEMVIYDEADR